MKYFSRYAFSLLPSSLIYNEWWDDDDDNDEDGQDKTAQATESDWNEYINSTENVKAVTIEKKHWPVWLFLRDTNLHIHNLGMIFT